MAKQRYVNSHFWDDTFVVGLDPIEKLLFLYFLTNPLTNIAGAYEVSIRRVAFDTGIDGEMVLKVLDRFEKANKVIYRDGWVLILNFIKNQSLNPKIVAGIEEAVKRCPNWIKDRLSIAYESLSHLNPNRNSNGMVGDSLLTENQPTVRYDSDETDEEYLTRKQKEFPKHNVRQVFAEFKRKVESGKYPHLKVTRPHFDRWLATEDVPINIDTAKTVPKSPTSSEKQKQREEFLNQLPAEVKL